MRGEEWGLVIGQLLCASQLADFLRALGVRLTLFWALGGDRKSVLAEAC